MQEFRLGDYVRLLFYFGDGGKGRDNGYLSCMIFFFRSSPPLVSLQKQVLEIGIEKVPPNCTNKGQEV